MPSARRATVAVSFLVAVLAAASAVAWWAPGHRRATRTAIAALGDQVPAFFGEGAAAIVHGVTDPDMLREAAGRELGSTEGPEHYFDIELLDGAAVPPTRRRFLRFCREKKLEPAKVGLLPYAIVEWAQRLTVAFAEHRKWPDNPHVRAKCLVYAGILAHYAQDLCQPLHTTVHFDGRTRPDGASPRSGIHMKMDDLLGRVKLDTSEAAKDVKPRVLDDVLRAVVEEVKRSNAMADRVYELESQLPTKDTSWTPTRPVRELANERLCASARMTADLFLTAWRQSADVKLPNWLERTSGGQAQNPDPKP